MATRGVLARSLELERAAIRRAFAAGLLVALATVGLAGTSAWLIVRAAQRPVVLSLTVPMGLVQLFALAKAGGRYAERTQTHRAALSVMGHVRATIARLLEPLVPAGLGPRSSEVVDLALRDVERVQDLLTAVAGPLLTGAVAGVATVIVTGLVVPWSAPMLLAGVVATAAIVPLGAARWGGSSELALDAVRREMVGLFDDAAQSGDEYVLNGAASRLEARLVELEERYDAARRKGTLATGVATALGILVAGASVAGATWMTALDLGRGSLSASLVAVPALLSVAALELMGTVGPAMVGLRGDRQALARLETLARRRAPVADPSSPGPPVDAATTVIAKSVSLRYGDEPVLMDVSTELRPGDFVTLHGPSGGGKTTLARLLAKFIDPTGGSLFLGDAPYGAVTSRQVRERVGYVDDAPHVFSTTLAANLRIAAPRATDEELHEACAAAGLSDLVASMPEGAATVLGGASTGLSGGEQRRLGVARELLVKRPVSVFDEPTEGLDEAGAHEMLEAIARRYATRCVVVVSHFPEDRRMATRRLELRDGTLVEPSTFAAL